jgi:hypothetical protein
MAATTAASASRLCLKALAPHTFEVMRELGTGTSEDIATLILNRLMGTNPALSGQETVRRRIYDVINVLSAAGVIDKVGKQIIWRGSQRPFIPLPTGSIADVRISSKEALLRDKVALLALHKALLKRNFVRQPGPDAVSLPVILIGIKDPSKTTFTQSLNRTDLEIKSTRDLVFLSPSDILFRAAVSRESARSILALSPELARYGQRLLDEETTEEKDEK